MATRTESCASRPEQPDAAASILAWTLINLLQAILTVLWFAAGIVVGVVIRWLTGRPDATLSVARRYWAPFVVRGAGARVQVSGLERVDFSRPHLLVLNHQSLLDIPVAIYALPTGLYFVAKSELRAVPLLGWYIAQLGMILVPRQRGASALAELAKAADLLAQGKSVVSFPEGTRSRDGRVGPFRTGVFVPAIEADAAVVPVAVQGTDRVLPPGGFRLRPGPVQVVVGEPIETAALQVVDRRWLAAEARRRIICMLAELDVADRAADSSPL